MMILWMSLALGGEPHGWRNDGSNAYPGASAPTVVSPASAAWTTALPVWGNASPVVVGSKVCTTYEPTTIVCADAATGRVLWKSKVDVLDALPADLAAIIRPQIEAAAAAETALSTLKRTYSSLQRDARRAPDDANLQSQLVTAAAEMDRLKGQIDAVVAYRTPADKEIIGYASATPVSDGERIYALFGTGALAAFTLDGRRLWTRWLGPHNAQMRGYHIGTAASPQLVDGVLVVPWDKLLGIDVSTGANRWDAGSYLDYGTPGVAHVGVGTIITPDGRIIRATDGRTLQTGIGNIWYVGPIVDGADVYFVGSTSDGHSTKRTDAAVVKAVRLSSDGGSGVSASERWTVSIPTSHTFYAQPVLYDGAIYAVTQRGEARAISTTDGTIQYTVDLAPRLFGEVFASPTVAGGNLVVFGATGVVLVGKTGPAWVDVAEGRVATMRATPVYVGDRMFLHTYEGLSCLKTGG
jgi:hypothetical protein